MALFADVGDVLSKADELITKKKSATTAVALALLAGEEMEAQEALMGAGGRLSARRREIELGLEGVAPDDRDALAAAAHELAFLEKWQRQVQERMGAMV